MKKRGLVDMNTQHLLNAAYAAPSSGDIQPLLTMLCDFAHQGRATYNEYLPDDTLPRTLVSHGINQDTSADFLNRHHQDNIWWHRRSESPTLNRALFHASRDISQNEQDNSLWYQDFMVRHNMADAFSICAADTTASQVAVTVISDPAEPNFDPTVLREVDQLYPHLSQALALYCRLRNVELERNFFESTSCSKQQAHVLLDHVGRIVECTDDAMDIIRKNDGISTDAGYLKLQDQTLDQRLAASFRQTLNATKSRSLPRPLAVERPSGETPYVLDFCPWDVKDAQLTNNQSYVLITLFAPNRKPDLRDELIQTAYGLSGAETRVVKSLVNGMDLKEIAATTHITVYTVRNHLKSVFAKTGFKRQGDLIGKMVSFIAE